MRIEARGVLIAVVWLTAFLWLAAASNVASTLSASREPRETSHGHVDRRVSMYDEYKHSMGLTYREMQNMLREEAGEHGVVDCCPTIAEMTEPTGGKNRHQMYVELYRDGDIAQRFYEYSCRPEVLDKPCRFIDRKLANQSRCVQKFTYTYAIIRDQSNSTAHPGEEISNHKHRHNHFPPLVSGLSWALDYIRIRNGCSCEVSPKPKKKKTIGLKTKKIKNKFRKHRDPEFD